MPTDLRVVSERKRKAEQAQTQTETTILLVFVIICLVALVLLVAGPKLCKSINRNDRAIGLGIGELLAVAVAHDKAGGLLRKGPRWRQRALSRHGDGPL